MSTENDHEPVFVRSKWGTNRYVYNPRNPVGVALIVLSLLFAAGAMYSLRASSQWSEDELRDAVHRAAGTLDGSPQRKYDWTGHSDYSSLIDDAIRKTGVGPRFGARVSEVGDETHLYEIGSDDTEDVHCMTITEIPGPKTDAVSWEVHLDVSVEDHGCEEPER
ncbi:hypothetical protein AB0A69_06830 [Streptomyces sp. NPDC045431]|uniref:hypothetical protein n=1 Tax=Streptomyces sp. NPDC045431 TaxID=3155613 RepID=UPI0033D0DF4A